MPDSFLAFDEANSYLDKQQRSLDYLDRIQKLAVITKNSIDIKNTNGYNRAVYINKLNHLSKLPTTSIVFTKSALKEHVGKSLNASELKKFLRAEDFTVYPEFMDGTNKQIEHAAQHNIDVINSVFHTNTAKFVNTKEEKDEE